MYYLFIFVLINIKIHTVGNACERLNITEYIYLICTTTTTTATMTTDTNNVRSLCIKVSRLRTYNAMEKHFSIITHIRFDKCVVS